MKLLGFSLIELMVVIAIVAILAAVAAPAYTSYMRQSKVGAALKVVDSITQKGMLYMDKNGTAPADITDLGMTMQASLPDSVANYPIPPYVSFMGGAGTIPPTGCPRFNTTVYISNTDGGGFQTDSSIYPYMFFNRVSVNVNGVWQHLCYYTDYSSTGAANTQGLKIDGCYQIGGTGDQLAAMNAAYDALDGQCL